MPNTIQVTGDDAPFLAEQETIGKGLEAVRENLSRVSLTKVCLECGEDIGEARRKAMPNATLCIDCAKLIKA